MYDTCALLNLQQGAFNTGEKFWLSQCTLMELEDIKTSASKDDDIKYKARRLLHLLDEHKDQWMMEPDSISLTERIVKMGIHYSPDNIIIASALEVQDREGHIDFVTDDLACGLIAESFGLDVERSQKQEKAEEYKGFKEVTMNHQEILDFYGESRTQNIFGLLRNEYLIVREAGTRDYDVLKWDGKEMVDVEYKNIKSDGYYSSIKPLNAQQDCAFDMLQSPDTTIKVLTGNFGTGKTLLCISNALDLLRRGKFQRIIFVRNTVEVKNTKGLGFLPGDKNSKIEPFAMCFADHLGGVDGLQHYLDDGSIVLEPLNFLRGRDFQSSLIYCNEAENCTKEHIQLLIGRVGKGSQLWLDGDLKQVDGAVFEQNNGLRAIVDRLKGNQLFAHVQLQTIERSATARLADLLDN